MFEEKPVEIPPVPHQIRGAAWTWSPGDELLSVPLKGDIPHLLSLTLAAGLHGSRQEFGISISSLGEGFASQPETLLKTRPALCKERISLMKQSWNKFIKMKRKCSLSQLTACWLGSSCCSLYFIQLKCCWSLSRLQEPQSEPGKPEKLMLNSNTFIIVQLLRQGSEQGCCPGDAPIPAGPFSLQDVQMQTSNRVLPAAGKLNL